MGINCIRFIMGPVHTQDNDLSQLDLASNSTRQTVRILFVHSEISTGCQYIPAEHLLLQVVLNSVAISSHYENIHINVVSVPQPQCMLSNLLLVCPMYSSSIFMINRLRGSSGVQYQQYPYFLGFIISCIGISCTGIRSSKFSGISTVTCRSP